MRFGHAYYDARKVQAVLAKTISNEETPARDVVRCTDAWISLERLKREIRGIPPLERAKLHELTGHMKRTRRAANYEPVEI